MNGARYAWMGVNLLPFLDRERLKAAMNAADQNEELLKPNEKKFMGEIQDSVVLAEKAFDIDCHFGSCLSTFLQLVKRS